MYAHGKQAPYHPTSSYEHGKIFLLSKHLHACHHLQRNPQANIRVFVIYKSCAGPKLHHIYLFIKNEALMPHGHIYHQQHNARAALFILPLINLLTRSRNLINTIYTKSQTMFKVNCTLSPKALDSRVTDQ